MKAPATIIIELNIEKREAFLSFGEQRQRKRRIEYDILNPRHQGTNLKYIELFRAEPEAEDNVDENENLKDTLTEGIKTSRASDDDKKHVKDTLAKSNKQIVNLDKIRKITDVNCNHRCKYFGFIHPCMVCWNDSKKYLCIKDWIKAGNRKITNPNQVIEINPNGDLLRISGAPDDDKKSVKDTLVRVPIESGPAKNNSILSDEEIADLRKLNKVACCRLSVHKSVKGKNVCGHVLGNPCEEVKCCRLCSDPDCNSRCNMSGEAGGEAE